MPERRTWPAYVVLALCGAPIVGIAAWKIVHETPVQSLVIELDADGNATLTANRRWTSEVRTGFRLPRDNGAFFDVVGGFVRECRCDASNGLPACPVHVAMTGEVRAGHVLDVMAHVMRRYLWDVTLDFEGTSVSLPLPNNQGGGAIPNRPPPRDLSLAALCVSSQGSERTFESTRLVLSLKIPDPRSSWDLCDPGVGVLDASEWRRLVKASDERKTVALAAPEDADLSGVDAAYVLADANAAAADLVRALAFLTSREGLKVYIVWPEREGDKDWWGAP